MNVETRGDLSEYQHTRYLIEELPWTRSNGMYINLYAMPSSFPCYAFSFNQLGKEAFHLIGFTCKYGRKRALVDRGWDWVDGIGLCCWLAKVIILMSDASDSLGSGMSNLSYQAHK